MKNLKYIAIAIVVVLLVAGALFIDHNPFPPSSSYEAMPRELRKAILADWPADRFDGHRWGSDAILYYGTHKGCVAFLYREVTWPYVNHRVEVAGYEFRYSHYFEIIVFRDGEYIDLSEAYQRGWLNKWQIESMARYHESNPAIFDQIGF